MLDTLEYLSPTAFPAIQRGQLNTLQVNLGYICNQQCLHCHVDASPRRKETMLDENLDIVKQFLLSQEIHNLDLTGGAPEINNGFRDLVSFATKQNVHVIDRCNLTVMFEPGQEDLATFLATHKVEVIASLPCYLEENVDAQRGKGVFDLSIRGLRLLNSLGYGSNNALPLNLVFNPQGPVLPPNQQELEASYKKVLKEKYEITFNNLFTLANMPIKRFGSTLLSKGEFESYMQLLKSSHSDDNLDGVMCRDTLSVDWQGYVFDCDFNQMLGLPSHFANRQKSHLKELIDYDFADRPIVVRDHCYGCTAGQGSSCGGALGE